MMLCRVSAATRLAASAARATTTRRISTRAALSAALAAAPPAGATPVPSAATAAGSASRAAGHSILDSASAQGVAGSTVLPPPLLAAQSASNAAAGAPAASPFEPTLSRGEEALHFRINDTITAKLLARFPTAEAQATAAAAAPVSSEKDYIMPHRIWTKDEVQQVEITHHKPEDFIDWAAYGFIKCIRGVFDVCSGFAFGRRTESKWLTRIIFLESVAAVPGMVGAMIRHLQSLRLMRRDHGWIHTLLEEAENERMHLLTALQLKQPSTMFRLAVLGVQGVMTNLFFMLYLVVPRFVHRLVGYLEEEAVYTYTKCIADIESGSLPEWSQMPAPQIASKYWQLPKDAMFKDVIYAIRSDEAHHRLVNHTFANLHQLGLQRNPYGPGE